MTRNEAIHVLHILKRRNDLETIVTLTGGQVITVMNTQWGRDLGVDFEHIYANITPPIEGREMEFFLVSEITEVADEWGAQLFKPASLP